MAAVGFDTHEAVKALTEVSFSEAQAESVISTVRNALGGDLATKADLQRVKSELEAKIESEIQSLQLRLTMRLGGLMIAVSGLVVALIKFLP